MTNQPINSMEQSLFLRSQQSLSQSRNSLILWNPKVNYRVHKGPPIVSTQSRMHPVHTSPTYSLKYSLILSSHLRLGLRSVLFPSGFPNKILDAVLLLVMCAIGHAHLILPELITLIILVKRTSY